MAARVLLDLKLRITDRSLSATEMYAAIMEELSQVIPNDWASIGVLAPGRKLIGAMTYPAVNFDFDVVVPALDETIHEQKMLCEIEASNYSVAPHHLDYAFRSRGLNYLESGIYREAYRLLDCRDQIGMVIHNEDVREVYGSTPCWVFLNFIRANRTFTALGGSDDVEEYGRILVACYRLILSRKAIKQILAKFNRELYAKQRIVDALNQEGTYYDWHDCPDVPFAGELFDYIKQVGGSELAQWVKAQVLVRQHDGITDFQRYAQNERMVTLSGGESHMLRLYQFIDQSGFVTRLAINGHNGATRKRMNDTLKKVIAGVSLGYANEAIARKLGLSTRTVESYISDVQKSLGIPGDDYNKRVVLALHFQNDPEIQREAMALRSKIKDS
ncbi:LuxR C-terminal-related transcriptional regulator [Cerasicoccus maritimus]|uniref:LuxR C-terminal-related transcriptional regulator n=1 Tax=Cerasicoccus maritimus TaxID=490089 RepID=UPI002852617F|nr:LuxR C-terminal-related transcriptional regulator [Cerasicoccus maritimus]